MAKARAKSKGRGQTHAASSRVRWLIVMGAVMMAAVAIHVLFDRGEPDPALREATVESPDSGPALDEIDAESRAAMRDLLRAAGED